MNICKTYFLNKRKNSGLEGELKSISPNIGLCKEKDDSSSTENQY